MSWQDEYFGGEDQARAVIIAAVVVVLVLSLLGAGGGRTCPDGTHEVTVEHDSQNGTTKVCEEG